jgi:peroxiredoxin
LTFDVLSDRRNGIARLFGLVFRLPEELSQLYQKFGADLPKFNGDDSWTLPMPGRFIIGQDSTIHGAELDPDYTVRPDPRLTVELLRALPGKK